MPGTRPGMTVEESVLLSGHPQGGFLDIGKTPGKALAFRIHKGRSSRARNGIDRSGERNLTCQRGPDDATLDGTINGGTTRMGVAVAHHQPYALGDLARQFRRQMDRVADQGEPGVDLSLLLLVPIATRTQCPQLGENEKAQITADG